MFEIVGPIINYYFKNKKTFSFILFLRNSPGELIGCNWRRVSKS